MRVPTCKDDARREAVRAFEELNGLDYLEVSPEDEKVLNVYFLGKLPPPLREDGPGLVQYLRVEGGRRIRDIEVVDVDPHESGEPDLDDYLTVRLNKSGDFSTYTLRLVNLQGVDARYDRLDFNFKLDCPSTLDCAEPPACSPPAFDEPEISYLAKDYASFRQLILDRLALLMPDWRERHVPDLGVAIVELLAYVGDYLSYFQDAVATEAYLDTARRRISVRRHARLVDYLLDEGRNARAWVAVETGTNTELDPRDVYFITGIGYALPAAGSVLVEEDLRELSPGSYEIFEPLVADSSEPIPVRVAHNEIHFYDWGDRECCLPLGATSATLVDKWVFKKPAQGDESAPEQYDAPAQYLEKASAQYLEKGRREPPWQEPRPRPERFGRVLELKVGDVLIFEEVLGPRTGVSADADPAHRHAVRLTRVEPSEDILFKKKVEADGQEVELPLPIVEIEWAVEDALPFPLCLSAIGRAPECAYVERISVARGNVILVDHGDTLPEEDLVRVNLKSSRAECDCAGRPSEISFTADRFAPRLAHVPLTHAAPLVGTAPAAHTLAPASGSAAPQVGLVSIPPSPFDAAPLFARGDLDDPTTLLKKLFAPEARDKFPLSRRTRSLLAKHPADEPPTDELRRALLADLQTLLEVWSPRPDLLASGGGDRHFVVEVDDEGFANLRFGDGELGASPRAGAAFYATYRVGNGRRGNVGAEAIRHLVFGRERQSGVNLRARNPLPAAGGAEPEPLSEARLYAPAKFRKQLARAVIAGDYAQLAQREFAREVQRAAGALTWTGSWYEASVAIDELGDEPPASNMRDLLAEIEGMLHRYRRMGHDLAVRRARRVPLDIALAVCVRPGFLRGHVEAALRDVFSNRVLPGGRRGYFHPDNLTFGEGIYLSRLVAAAHGVEGVEGVQVTRLQRLFEAPNQELARGVLPLGTFEVAQLDNDPSFPEHGRLALTLKGGR